MQFAGLVLSAERLNMQAQLHHKGKSAVDGVTMKG